QSTRRCWFSVSVGQGSIVGADLKPAPTGEGPVVGARRKPSPTGDRGVSDRFSGGARRPSVRPARLVCMEIRLPFPLLYHKQDQLTFGQEAQRPARRGLIGAAILPYNDPGRTSTPTARSHPSVARSQRPGATSHAPQEGKPHA